jgi:hypothetical protein
MGESTEKAPLRDHTGSIRHLDVVRARRLVQFFARPAVLDDGRLTWDDSDSLAAATHGWLTLDHPEAAGGSAVVGHYKTHLYLHGLVRLQFGYDRVERTQFGRGDFAGPGQGGNVFAEQRLCHRSSSATKATAKRRRNSECVADSGKLPRGKRLSKSRFPSRPHRPLRSAHRKGRVTSLLNLGSTQARGTCDCVGARMYAQRPCNASDNSSFFRLSRVTGRVSSY